MYNTDNTVSDNRLLPVDSDSTAKDEAGLTKPSIDLQSVITESDQLIPAYTNQNPCRRIFSIIFVMVGCSFDLYLPMAIALLLQQICDHLNQQNGVDRQTLDAYSFGKILTSLVCVNLVSSICDWAANNFIMTDASKAAKEMRYDFYYCQVKKIFKRKQNNESIDHESSTLAFNMKDIDESIQVVHESIGKKRLKTYKTRVISSVALIMLFFLSWRLTLFFIGLSWAWLAIRLRLGKKSVLKEKTIQEKKGELYNIAKSSQSEDANLRERSNSFDLMNKEIFTLGYNHHNFDGFLSFTANFASRLIQMGLVFFVYNLYLSAQETENISTMSMKNFGAQYLSAAVIVAFFMYLVQIGLSAQYLASAERWAVFNKINGAIDKLFSYVSMTPQTASATTGDQ